jgi:hypothetical protein
MSDNMYSVNFLGFSSQVTGIAALFLIYIFVDSLAFGSIQAPRTR